jgi:hypothetical protein
MVARSLSRQQRISPIKAMVGQIVTVHSRTLGQAAVIWPGCLAAFRSATERFSQPCVEVGVSP